MSRGRKIGLVAAMWALGAAMLAVFVWVVEVRVSTPVAASTPSSQERARQAPLAALAAGAAEAAGKAVESFRGWPASEGVHALEAAHRVTVVGYENASGPARQSFAAAEKRLRAAREALHNGRVAEARTQVRGAVAELEAAEAAAVSTSAVPPVPPPPLALGDYEGTQVVNLTGSRLGRVDDVRERGGEPTVVLQLGGVYDDLFKVLHWGGQRVEVRADRLLYGPRRSLGYVWVVVPTTSTRPAAVLDDLQ